MTATPVKVGHTQDKGFSLVEFVIRLGTNIGSQELTSEEESTSLVSMQSFRKIRAVTVQDGMATFQ
jgi:hypothetical protein